MKPTYSKVSYSDLPFLSIVTRVYQRPKGFANNQLSVDALTDKDCEQIFITDTIGHGMLAANESFSHPQTKALIEGEYVYLLDDDDFITNPDMIAELKKIAQKHNPDIIFFRMIIKNDMNGNLYPTTELCWGNKPIIARIGGSCFVVKRDLWMKHIDKFAQPRCGDFAFINAVFNDGAICHWHDVVMAETGMVSRGKPEKAW